MASFSRFSRRRLGQAPWTAELCPVEAPSTAAPGVVVRCHSAQAWRRPQPHAHPGGGRRRGQGHPALQLARGLCWRGMCSPPSTASLQRSGAVPLCLESSFGDPRLDPVLQGRIHRSTDSAGEAIALGPRQVMWFSCLM